MQKLLYVAAFARTYANDGDVGRKITHRFLGSHLLTAHNYETIIITYYVHIPWRVSVNYVVNTYANNNGETPMNVIVFF